MEKFGFGITRILYLSSNGNVHGEVWNCFRGHATEVGICAGQAYILNAVGMMEVEHDFLTYDISIFSVSVDWITRMLHLIWKPERWEGIKRIEKFGNRHSKDLFYCREAEYPSPSFSVVTWPLAQLPARNVAGSFRGHATEVGIWITHVLHLIWNIKRWKGIKRSLEIGHGTYEIERCKGETCMEKSVNHLAGSGVEATHPEQPSIQLSLAIYSSRRNVAFWNESGADSLLDTTGGIMGCDE
ncbi:hypothetical protein JOM56_013217 [Amanita muscaria]